ncbi:MAG TPA: DUF748 domain-containing protein, partial [Leptolyngbyaceae cyanobacterium M65_K2018_010]|nr:DUF748 domain-containing protein [Leptolyngbyaceae cyanobacterium M65_K2018_010]
MAVDQDRNPTDPVPPSGWGSLGRWGKAIAIGGGAVVLAGLVAGWWGYSLLRRELPQFLQDNLSVALGRPIKVGEFERFSPTGVRLGPSIVPPTEDNFSWVKARALEVNFNPLELIWTRTLRPSLVFIEPQMAVKQGFDGDWRVLPPGSIGQRGWIKTELRSLQIRNAALAIGPISRSSIVELPPGVTSATLILLENVNLRLRFSGTNNQTATLIVGGRLNQGSFQARGEGQLDTLQTNLAIQAQQIPIESVNPLFGGGFFVREGLLSANLDLKVRPRAPEPLTVTGTARLRNGDIVITDLPAPLQEINGTLIATGLGGRLEHSSLKLGPILARAEGTIDLRQGNNLFITLPDVSLAQVEAVLGQPLPLEAVGRFRVETQVTGALDNPQLTGRLDALDQVRVDRLGLDAIQAQFTANLGGFTLTQAMVRPAPGGTLTAQGTADFNRADWRRPSLSFAVQTDLPLDSLAQLYEVPIPNPIQLGPLLAEAQITGYPNDLRGRVDWRLPQATFPGQGQVTYAQGVIQAPKALFQVGEGRLQAQAEVNLNNLNWQAHGVGADLSLGLLSPQLRGRLDTDVRVSGNLRHLTPAAMGATGQIQLSQAIPLHREGVDRLLPGPLQARFIWNGQRLEVPEASAPNFYARGGADITFAAGGGRPTISGMDFTTRFTHLNLAVAYALLDGPTWLRPQGYVDFDGTLRGFLGNPQIAGIAGLRQFSINDLAWFEEVSGPIRASLTEGAQLSLLGAGNEISADIDPSLRPNTFRLSNGEFLVTGQRQGSILEAEVRHFDLGRLAIRPFESPDIGLNLGTLSGLLHATAQIDLSELFNPAIAADLVVDRPGLGVITADRLTGQLHYREGLVLLTGGNLQLTPNTRFLITGQGRLFPEWQVSAAISTPQADFQDILHTLRLYSYADFGRLLRPPTPGSGADLAVTPVGMPEAALLDQASLARALDARVIREKNRELRRGLGQMVDQQQARALLPSLDQLEGQVSGRLGVAVDPRAGLSADFEFSGQNWAWGRYDFDNQFLARGEVHHQTLVLDPVEFCAGATRLSLVGQVSAQDSNLTI